MTDSALREIADDPSSRKRFFKMLGGAGAVGAATVLIAACGDDKKKSPTTSGQATTTPEADNASDLKIVNYALTLEYLEATFYQEVLDSGVIKDKKIGDLANKVLYASNFNPSSLFFHLRGHRRKIGHVGTK